MTTIETDERTTKPHRRFLWYLVLLLLPALAVLVWCWLMPVTTVLLVRHGERLNASDTSSLSPEGFERATTLRHVAGSSRITKIFVSDLARTQQTAGPLSAALGIPPVVVPKGSTAALIDSISAHAGEVILIVGHSDTLPEILDGLGAPPVPISPSSFDNLFIVTRRSLGVQFVHLKYGRPT